MVNFCVFSCYPCTIINQVESLTNNTSNDTIHNILVTMATEISVDMTNQMPLTSQEMDKVSGCLGTIVGTINESTDVDTAIIADVST